MIQLHYSAVKTLIELDPALAGKGYDTARRNPDGGLVRDTYWILFGGAPDTLESGRLTAEMVPTSDAVFSYTVRAVSTDTAGCRAVLQHIYDATVGRKPVVAGRRLRSLQFETASDVEPDDSVKPPLFLADLELTLYSYPL